MARAVLERCLNAAQRDVWFETVAGGQYTRAVAAMTAWLVETAGRAQLRKYRKHPRGPKQPPVQREHDPRRPHLSVARLRAQRQQARGAQPLESSGSPSKPWGQIARLPWLFIVPISHPVAKPLECALATQA